MVHSKRRSRARGARVARRIPGRGREVGPALPIATLLTGLLAAAPLYAQQIDLPDGDQPLSVFDPQTDWMREAWRRGHGIRPATAASAVDDWIQNWRMPSPPVPGLQLRPELTLIGLGTDPHRQLRPDFADIRAGTEVDPAWRLRAGALVEVGLRPALTGRVRFVFDTEGANEPLNRTRDFAQLDASNNFDEAWLRWGGPHAHLHLGRLPLRWGPERLGSLLLSSTAPAADMIRGTLRWGPHLLQSFAGQLSSETLDDGTGLRRWLYGHRADLRFLQGRLRVGLSETALVAGSNESLNLRYVNPLPLWAQVQVEQDEDSGTQVNVFDAVDFEAFLAPRDQSLRLYGSLVVDDLQIDPAGRRRDPDQIAWAAGLDLAPRAHDHWLLGYEYRRIGSWIYLHRGAGTDYHQYERPLGAPEGPDTDRHDLRLDLRPWANGHVWVEGERRRRGENRLWTDLPRTGNAGRAFPLGTVEKRWIVRVGAEWVLHGTTKAALQAAFHAVENLNSVPGRDEDLFELRLVLFTRGPLVRTRLSDEG